jgi:2-dehydro-3-deoxyphosphogluconate aldolase/(4S)-4-hydroxy-2-oxoglutarate aldolase
VIDTPILARLAEARLVTVATFSDPAQAVETAHALQAGGLAVIEVTFRTAGAADAIRALSAIPGVCVGAGTVLSAETAREAADAGAAFAVSPALNERVLETCQEIGLPFFPGVATPTEIDRARGLGLDTVKLFPAARLGGPGFIRDVAAVYPEMWFIASGGIGPDEAPAYLSVPAVLAVCGSWTVKPERLRARRFDEVTDLARAAARAVVPAEVSA